MNKNIHTIDGLISEAHEQFEEAAPDGAWQKLQADLDRQDADKYKRRSNGWKRISLVLLLLLSGVIMYEAANIKIKSGQKEKMTDGKSTSKKTFTTNNESMLLNHELSKDITKQKAENSNLAKVLVSQQENNRKDKLNTLTNDTVAGNINMVITFIYPKRKKLKENRVTTSKLSSNVGELNENSTTPLDKFDENDKRYAFPQARQDKEDILTITVPKWPRQRLNVPTIGLKISPIADIILIPSGRIVALNTIEQSLKKKNAAFKPYWSATAYASNDWSMYQLDNDVQDNTGNNQYDKENVIKREKHESSYSAGATITRQFSKSIGVKTGIIFSNTAIGISPQEIYATKQNRLVAYKYITSSGYGFIKPAFGSPPTVGDSLKSAAAQHNLKVLSIPLSVSYLIQKMKFSIILSAGISANFITSAKVKTEVSDALNREAVNITELDGIQRFYTAFVADANVQYHINSKLSVNLLPTFTYALSPITKNNVVKTFPYSLGLGTGLTIKF